MCLNSQNVMSNPPYCLPYNLCDFSLENLELDQPVIPKLIKFSFFSSLVHFILYCNNVRTNFVWVTGGSQPFNSQDFISNSPSPSPIQFL